MLETFNRNTLHSHLLKIRKTFGKENCALLPTGETYAVIVKRVESTIKKRVDDVMAANKTYLNSSYNVAFEFEIDITNSNYPMLFADSHLNFEIEKLYKIIIEFFQNRFGKENTVPGFAYLKSDNEYIVVIFIVPIVDGQLGATKLRNMSTGNVQKIKEALYDTLIKFSLDTGHFDYELLPISTTATSAMNNISGSDPSDICKDVESDNNKRDDIDTRDDKDAGPTKTQSADNLSDLLLPPLEIPKANDAGNVGEKLVDATDILPNDVTDMPPNIDGEETVENSTQMLTIQDEIAELEYKIEINQEIIGEMNAEIEKYRTEIQEKRNVIKAEFEQEQLQKRNRIINQYVLNKIENDRDFREKLFVEIKATLDKEDEAKLFV